MWDFFPWMLLGFPGYLGSLHLFTSVLKDPVSGSTVPDSPSSYGRVASSFLNLKRNFKRNSLQNVLNLDILKFLFIFLYPALVPKPGIFPDWFIAKSNGTFMLLLYYCTVGRGWLQCLTLWWCWRKMLQCSHWWWYPKYQEFQGLDDAVSSRFRTGSLRGKENALYGPISFATVTFAQREENSVC